MLPIQVEGLRRHAVSLRPPLVDNEDLLSDSEFKWVFLVSAWAPAVIEEKLIASYNDSMSSSNEEVYVPLIWIDIEAPILR